MDDGDLSLETTKKWRKERDDTPATPGTIRSRQRAMFDDLPLSYKFLSPEKDEGALTFSTLQRGYASGEFGLLQLLVEKSNTYVAKDGSKKIVQEQSSAEKKQAGGDGGGGYDSEDDEWDYPGWGSVLERIVSPEDLESIHMGHKGPQLDVARSTAIAGNDLLASVLYTTGIVCTACAQNAPFAMLLSGLALFPFRKIFQEVGTALPLNGGVYVAMLNSASKLTATFAATCSLISYSATAVVSAASCTSYAAGVWGDFPIVPVTVAILAAFAVLVVFGVKDSANVALAIFTFHICTLLILLACSFAAIFGNKGEMWILNWNYPLPVSPSGGVGMDIYLGYSVALLGLTGFETSANYIEEAGPFETERNKIGAVRQVSVFEKTIDRMWYLVIFFNPLIAIATLGLVDMTTITSNASNILSIVGARAGGQWLSTLVSVDAIFVLAGGVLTAYVGVTGLIKQLASDRCLPTFLLRTNRFGTNHLIILCFFLLCTTLYLMTNGNVLILSGVFSIAFLMVLLSFAVANMKLKMSRPRLSRGAKSTWLATIFGFVAMFVGLVGNIIYDSSLLFYFLIYLSFFFGIIIATHNRMRITKLVLYFVRQVPMLKRRYEQTICSSLRQMKKHTVVFFTKTSELHILNKAVLYARDNELCDHLILTHVYAKTETASSPSLQEEGTVLHRPKPYGPIPSQLKENLRLLGKSF